MYPAEIDHESPWMSMHIHGNSWLESCFFHDCSWKIMKVHGYSWKSMTLKRNIFSDGYPWKFMDKILNIFMDIHGTWWTLMDSFYFLRWFYRFRLRRVVFMKSIPLTSFTVRELQMPSCFPSQAFPIGKILKGLNCKISFLEFWECKLVM